MKRFVFLSIFAACAHSGLFALPIGNPADPTLYPNSCVEQFCSWPCLNVCDWASLRVGYYGDFVYNRNLKIKDQGQHFEKFQFFTNAGYLALNICDRVDFFTNLGATSALGSTNANLFIGSDSSGRLDVEFSDSFSYGLGTRIALLQFGCSTIGGEFQYFHSNLQQQRTVIFDTQSIYLTENIISYREWQLGLGYAYRIQNFIPYCGVKWSDVNIRLPMGSGVCCLGNTKQWGYAIGVTASFFCCSSLAVEARFGDEKALYANGQIRF